MIEADSIHVGAHQFVFEELVGMIGTDRAAFQRKCTSEAAHLMMGILAKAIFSFQNLRHEGRLCAAAILAA